MKFFENIVAQKEASFLRSGEKPHFFNAIYLHNFLCKFCSRSTRRSFPSVLFQKIYKLKIVLDFSMREKQKCEIFDVNSGNFSNTTVSRIRIFRF